MIHSSDERAGGGENPFPGGGPIHGTYLEWKGYSNDRFARSRK